MGCPECSRLSDLFAEAIRKNADLHAGNYAELKAGEKSEGLDLDAALARSTEEMKRRMRRLLYHEATHNGHTFTFNNGSPITGSCVHADQYNRSE